MDKSARIRRYVNTQVEIFKLTDSELYLEAHCRGLSKTKKIDYYARLVASMCYCK